MQRQPDHAWSPSTAARELPAHKGPMQGPQFTGKVRDMTRLYLVPPVKVPDPAPPETPAHLKPARPSEI
jgi:hypothetical protein